MAKPVQHVVARGETLTQIARENGTDVETILRDNPHLTRAGEEDKRPRDKGGNHIYQGDHVVIKKSEFKCAAGGPGQPLFSCRYSNREGQDVTIEPYGTTSVGPDGAVTHGAGITFKFDL